MTAVLCWFYCVFNVATWRDSEYERSIYLLRVAASAAMAFYLVTAGDVERTIVGLAAEMLVILELVMFAFAVDARDPRIYGEQQ
jgi:hypothetical protein